MRFRSSVFISAGKLKDPFRDPVDDVVRFLLQLVPVVLCEESVPVFVDGPVDYDGDFQVLLVVFFDLPGDAGALPSGQTADPDGRTLRRVRQQRNGTEYLYFEIPETGITMNLIFNNNNGSQFDAASITSGYDVFYTLTPGAATPIE